MIHSTCVQNLTFYIFYVQNLTILSYTVPEISPGPSKFKVGFKGHLSSVCWDLT